MATSCQDMGNGVRTVMANAAAEVLSALPDSARAAVPSMMALVELDPAAYDEVVWAIARLSLAALPSTTRANALDVVGCDRLVKSVDATPVHLARILPRFVEETARLRQPLEVDLPRGLVHGDAGAPGQALVVYALHPRHPRHPPTWLKGASCNSAN